MSTVDHNLVVNYDHAMSKLRYKIIINPTAGRGHGERIIPAVTGSLNKYGLDFDLVRSLYPGHTIELAAEAAVSGFDVVVGVGGDGTANEVINGLILAGAAEQLDIAMGVIGAGRGNDFAFGMEIPEDVDKACQILAANQRKTIDIGVVYSDQFATPRYFGNSLGIGFDAVVTMEALKMTLLSGVPNYLLAVLKTVFLYYKAPQVELRYDNEQMVLPALMISVMNGRRQGGTFYMTPDAKNDDGLFDLCIVHEVSKPRIFSLVPRFLKGTQFSQKEVQLQQAGHVKLTALLGVLPAHMDGEIISSDATELEIKLLPRCLQVICPE